MSKMKKAILTLNHDDASRLKMSVNELWNFLISGEPTGTQVYDELYFHLHGSDAEDGKRVRINVSSDGQPTIEWSEIV